jgi:hypothetical protein
VIPARGAARRGVNHRMSGHLASKLRRAACVVAAAVLATGCSTTGQPVQQSIWIDTPDCPAATCELRNDHGQWALPRTPGRVTVTTLHSPLEVVCRAGELRASSSAPSSLPPAGTRGAAAGAAIGGGAAGAATAGAVAIGMAPIAAVLVLYGAAVGAGAGQAIEVATRPIGYPERIVVPLRCTEAADGPRFGFTVRGPSDDEALRAKLPNVEAALVLSVAEGSPAAAAGLRSGDLVTGANGVAIESPARLQALARALPPQYALVLRITRDGAPREVRLVAP